MNEDKSKLSWKKYGLPYHWMRDPLCGDSLQYFGYVQCVLNELPAPPAAVLDAGCGDGRISAELVRRGYKVTGVDQHELSILYAKTFVPEGTFFVADLRRDLSKKLSSQQSHYDTVILVDVYEHIPPADCRIVLSNMYNLLKSNGILIASVPSRLLPLSKLHYRHFDRKEFEEELKTSGFRVEKMIFQHRIDSLTHFLFSYRVERFLNNQWLQPVFLKRLRRSFYMKKANIANNEQSCGRFIAVANVKR